MKRVVLMFSIRSRAQVSIDEMRSLVGAALNCDFRLGTFWDMRVDVAHVLGMDVALYPWRGRANQSIFRLQAEVQDRRFYVGPDGASLELVEQDISASIIGVLQVNGAGEWYVPTRDDIAAEAAYSYEYERQFEVTDADVRRIVTGE
jgi:hypothetical protein